MDVLGYSWWFRNPENSPVDVVNIPLFTGFGIHPNGGCLGFLNHQQYFWGGGFRCRISSSNQPPTNPPVSLQELAAAAQSVLLDSHAPSEAGGQSLYPRDTSGRDGSKKEFQKKTRKLFSKCLRKIKRAGFFSTFFFCKPRIGRIDLRLAVYIFQMSGDLPTSSTTK